MEKNSRLTGLKRLSGMRVYLSGSIDRSPDQGTGWRKEITPALKKLGLQVIDPTKTYTDKLILNDLEHINKLKAEGRFDEAEIYIEQHLLHTDLRFVDISDFMIVFIDPEVFIFGTVDEIVTACSERKPILAFVKGGKQKAPNWMIGRIGHKNIFNNMAELVAHLENIDSGKADVDMKKWLFWKTGEEEK